MPSRAPQPPLDPRHLLHTAEWETLSTAERRAIEEILREARVARNTNVEFLDRRSSGERLSDRIATFGGSWTFIVLFLSFILAWIVLNTDILGPRHTAFDAYPYVFLNLMLSMVAAIQAPVILMSQNRQAARDRLEAQNDYEVNLKAEVEIRALHDKLDILRQSQWAELVRLQQDQMRMLEHLLGERRAPETAADDTGNG